MLSKRIKANIVFTNNLQMKYAKKTILYIFLFTNLSVGAEVFEQKQLTLETQENKGFYEALGFKESTNNPYATNNEGAIGKYQILERTLKDLGYNWVTLETFRKDPNIFPEQLQLEALNKKIIGDIKFLQYQWFRKDSSINYLSYVGDSINGIKITLAGLIASCHIGGTMGTIRWIDSKGIRNPGDTNRSTIGAYMKEFSHYNFDLSCLKDYGKGLTLSTKQSKSYTTVLRLKDTATVMILPCLVTLNQSTGTIRQQSDLTRSTSEYKQLYLSTIELYSTLEVQHQRGMGILMLLGLGRLNGTTLADGLELSQVLQAVSEWHSKVIDYFNSTLNRFGMLLGMLRFAICSLNLAL